MTLGSRARGTLAELDVNASQGPRRLGQVDAAHAARAVIRDDIRGPRLAKCGNERGVLRERELDGPEPDDRVAPVPLQALDQLRGVAGCSPESLGLVLAWSGGREATGSIGILGLGHREMHVG